MEKSAKNDMRGVRAVLDTNIFISMLIGGHVSGLLYDAFISGGFKIIFSHPLLAELLETLKKERLKRLFHSEDIATLLELIRRDVFLILPRHRIQACRDPKDNIVLECAVEGGADFIVTGDKDLLSLNPYRGISIVTPRKFVGVLNIRG